jgi:hypothetical protein
MPKRPVRRIDEENLWGWLQAWAKSWKELAEPIAKIRRLLDEDPLAAQPEWPKVKRELLKALKELETTVRGRCVPPPVMPGSC